MLVGGIKLTGVRKIWKHKYLFFFWRNARNETSLILGSSPRALFVFKEDSLYLSFFFSPLPCFVTDSFWKTPSQSAEEPSKNYWSSRSLWGNITEIQSIYSWIGRRCILEWNTCGFLTPHTCLLRSDFVKGEDKFSLIWVEVMWAVWYLCHWKVKICLGIKWSIKDF